MALKIIANRSTGLIFLRSPAGSPSFPSVGEGRMETGTEKGRMEGASLRAITLLSGIERKSVPDNHGGAESMVCCEIGTEL